MGDYGFGLSTNDRALSPVDLNGLTNNQSLFSPEPLPQTTIMQDDTQDKSAVKQTLSSKTENSNGTEQAFDDSLTRQAPTEAQNGTNEEKEKTNVCDAMSMNSVITSLDQLGLSEPNVVINNFASTPGFWSTAATDDTFMQEFQAINGPIAFQNFPTNPATLFNNTNMTAAPPQLGLGVPQQQSLPHHRRAITGQQQQQHNFQQQRHSNMFLNNAKSYPPWSNAPHQQSWPQQSWSHQSQTNINPWGNLQQQQQQQNRQSMPNLNPIGAPCRKNYAPQTLSSPMLISPTKLRRNPPYSGPVMSAFRSKGFGAYDESRDGGMLGLQQQERSNPTFDAMRFSSREPHLLDIMRTAATEQSDPFKGKSPFGFVDESQLLDESSLDQTVPNMASPCRSSPNSQDRNERFSRKVFVGGLPPDIDEEEITAAFRHFGPLVVDWPHKAESKSYFPPKGYCFLLFQDEMSVQNLISACIVDDDKFYWYVSSPTMKDKPVQIRPWNLSDSDFVMDGSQPLDPRKTIFVGGVPRPLRAVELAMIMDRLYGGVCYAGIDTDPELKYPKGAGRVAFSNQQSYIAAISARFVQLQHGDIDKRVEVKPYVLDDQMCDECHGTRCNGKFAPFFCANVTCLQYYCEHCWAQIHARPGREFHKPLVKEGADRPRTVPFRWC